MVQMDGERENLLKEMREYCRIYKELSEVYHMIALRLGMSDSVFDILYAVYVLGEGCTQKDIGKYACATKSTIHSAVHKLERDGILRLERRNARESRVFLTPAGRALVDRKIARVVDMEERAFGGTAPLLRILVQEQMDNFTKRLRQEAEDL